MSHRRRTRTSSRPSALHFGASCSRCCLQTGQTARLSRFKALNRRLMRDWTVCRPSLGGLTASCTSACVCAANSVRVARHSPRAEPTSAQLLKKTMGVCISCGAALNVLHALWWSGEAAAGSRLRYPSSIARCTGGLSELRRRRLCGLRLLHSWLRRLAACAGLAADDDAAAFRA